MKPHSIWICKLQYYARILVHNVESLYDWASLNFICLFLPGLRVDLFVKKPGVRLKHWKSLNTERRRWVRFGLVEDLWMIWQLVTKRAHIDSHWRHYRLRILDGANQNVSAYLKLTIEFRHSGAENAWIGLLQEVRIICLANVGKLSVNANQASHWAYEMIRELELDLVTHSLQDVYHKHRVVYEIRVEKWTSKVFFSQIDFDFFFLHYDVERNLDNVDLEEWHNLM